MLIIFLELLFLAWFSCRLSNKIKGINTLIFISFLFNFFCLILYRIELTSIGRVVYYSDAETYWNKTLEMLSTSNLDNGWYVWWSFLIQKTSMFVSVFWNNISNLLLLDLAILILADIMAYWHGFEKNVRFFLHIVLFNPLISYSLFRNMKDALFFFSATLVIWLISRYHLQKKIVYLAIAVLIDCTIIMVRPWGFLVLPLTFFAFYLNSLFGAINFYRILRFLVKASILIVIAYYFINKTGFINHIYVWQPVILKNATSTNWVTLILGPFNIIMGPGWYRSLYGDKYFMFFTKTGNFYCVVGSIWWWLIIAMFISKFKRKNLEISKEGSAVIVILSFLLLIYSMQYEGGGLELRFRGIVYVLLSAAYLMSVKLDHKNMCVKPSFFSIILGLFFIGTYASM